MSFTRSQLKFEIWTHLNKSVATKGFYTDAKVNSAIQQCLDQCSIQMFLADEGWTHKLRHFDTVAGQVALPIPADIGMILEVRYLSGNSYLPMSYDQQWGEPKWSDGSGATQQCPGKYKLIDNNFYFTPPLGVGGKDFLELEYAAYPPKLRKDSDQVPAQYDRSMFWWTVFHSCVVLTTGVKMSTDWPAQEGMWWKSMIDMIGMRTRQVIPIKEFEG